ncbi:hypothetical protein CCR87_12595 [Rhodobaculum claviforme]|uniref:Methyltransferase domain-containing protein n=2 Tax=Rhodobaculum claviforme TaxID=1549854 RepID=A0A934TN72_9RHOB|nr:hypothetical protein [Rhodobaculum claviforme]
MAGDWRRPAETDAYEIVWQSDAAPGMLLPRPSHSDVAAAYAVEDYYTHGTRAGERAVKKRLLGRLLLRLAWAFDHSVDPTAEWWRSTLPSEPQRIIDFGCGDGRLLQMLTEMGHECVGVEPDAAAIAAARKRDIKVYPGTAEVPPEEIRGRKFDVVVMSHSLEHCLDPDSALENARDILAVGGMLIVEVPNNAALGLTVFGQNWHWLDAPRHLNFFDEVSLRSKVECIGFEVVDVSYRGYCRQFAAGWISTQDRISDVLSAGRGNETWRHLMLLLRTLKARPSRKYDSVRLVALRSNAAHHGGVQ